MKEKIFLTGGTGFIGKELLPLISKNNKVKCLIRKGSNIESINNFKINCVFGDLMDKESFSSHLNKKDIVIHLATSHEKGKEDKSFICSRNLIEVCKDKKIKKFIFISSMAANRKSLDDYGKSKLKIEELIKNSGLDYIILRPSIIYNENNLSLIGKSLKSIPFIIPIIGNGKYKMNPVHIKDVVKSINATIRTQQKNKIYDIAGAKNISFNEIIEICKKRFKIKKLKVHIPISLVLLICKFIPLLSPEAIKGVNEDTQADITELKKDLSINPISFEEGIKNANI
ncbi:MAG: NAD(P)H-binding protein [Candidatus Pacearchaeota archaeon]